MTVEGNSFEFGIHDYGISSKDHIHHYVAHKDTTDKDGRYMIEIFYTDPTKKSECYYGVNYDDISRFSTWLTI